MLDMLRPSDRPHPFNPFTPQGRIEQGKLSNKNIEKIANILVVRTKIEV
jgi:hypothetical protein